MTRGRQVRERLAHGPAALNAIVALTVCISLLISAQKALVAPITFDEAYTYLRFATQPIGGILGNSFPNNHVLHTVLVHLSTELFGSATWVIRLPAFLGGIAFLTSIVALSRRTPEPARTLWPIAVAFTPMVIEFDALARGYSLGSAACLWALWLLIRADSRLPDNGRRFPVMVIVGALLGLSLAFVPTFAIFCVGVVAASLVVRIGGRKGLTLRQLTLDATAGLIGVAPIVAITYARIDLTPSDWPWGIPDAASALREFLTKSLEFDGPIPLVGYLLAAAAIAALGLSLILAMRRRDAASMTILLTAVASIATLLVFRATLINVWPFPRILLLLVPLLEFPLFFVFSTPRTSTQPIGMVLGTAIAAALVWWTAIQWSDTYFPVWRDNAGVPDAVAAIRNDLPAGKEGPQLAYPWQLGPPLEYLIQRRGLEDWQLVAADDPTADYRILGSWEVAGDEGLIIFSDVATGIRVQQLATP
jgi:uncharacterized membrane protein